MLKKISIKNLGCFDDETYAVDFSPETLIAGPNNSGKSMLLAGINLIRYFIAFGPNQWSTEFYDLTNFDAAVHNHEPSRTIEVSVILTDPSKQYTCDLRISRETGFVLEVNRSTFRRTPGEVSRMSTIMRRIWYFRPNRSPVRYTSRVGPTAGPLQPLRPDGSNVINYLLERWTDRDPRWSTVESWLKKIDPDMSDLKTPIRGDQVSLETTFGDISVNVSLQGSGFQSAAAIVSAVIFSPEGSTIVIEEPEVFLHPNSQEVIVDMINDAVKNHNKQVIFSTHSCNILLPFYNDVGLGGARRGAEHVNADPKKFSMWAFKKAAGKISIERYPLETKTFKQFRGYFKHIWG